MAKRGVKEGMSAPPHIFGCEGFFVGRNPEGMYIVALISLISFSAICAGGCGDDVRGTSGG